MAGTPLFKVYRGNEYVASVKYPEDGAAIMACSPDGCTLRIGHRKSGIVYTSGVDGDPGESYDEVAATVRDRLLEMGITI